MDDALLWRNWIAHWTSNPEVLGSIPSKSKSNKFVNFLT